MNTFFLPAYNEEENIGLLLAKISSAMSEAGLDYRILVVDDGSSDRTPQILKEAIAGGLPLEVITHAANQGLPRTLFDGFAACTAHATGDDVIVCMDGDNTMEPSLAAREMVPLLHRSDLDVVVASRYRTGSEELGLSFSRKMLSLGVNLLLKARFAIRGVRDYSCGYRAYRAVTLARTMDAYGPKFIESTTFSAMAEILIKMGHMGIRAGEVAMVLHYDQKMGRSKINVTKTILNYSQMIMRPLTRPRAK